MNHFIKPVITFVVLSFAVLTGSSSVSASSASSSTQVDWIAVNPATGDTYIDGQVDIWSRPPVDSRTRLLAFDDWTQCWVIGNQSWVIASFSGSWGTIYKNLDLKCGSASTMGYFHILDKHETEWRNRIAQTGTGQSTDSWDDFMWWAAEQTWKQPAGTVNQGNGKICRYAPMEMYSLDGTGQKVYKYTFVPTFIWSMTNNHLITGFPPTTQYC